uniref:Costars domain-containing protein n=1 Tax=Caenorhabditis tropicalis TaxID=1561998 RepID=A0A1I7T3N9_9PELO
MESYIKFTKIRYFDYCQISIEKETFWITLNHSRLPAKYGDSSIGFRQTTRLTEKDLKPWSKEDLSMVENAVTVLKRLQTTYPAKETGVIFLYNTLAVVKKVLDALDDYVFVSLGKTNLEMEAVDLVMDSVKKGREISVNGSEMPLDYSHPNVVLVVLINP